VHFTEWPVLRLQRALFSFDSLNPRGSHSLSRASANTSNMESQKALRLLSLAALVLCGCCSLPQGSDAQSAAHSSQSRGLISGTISDPAMNGMAAQTMTIPGGWKEQGIVMTSPCTQIPSVVFRAYARDGLTEMRLTPTVAWKWNTSYNIPKESGCLPFSSALSAADFLGKYLETIPGGVHVVGPMPVDASFRRTAEDVAARQTQSSQRVGMNAGPNGQPAIRYTSDVAALHIQTRNGSFVIDQRLRAAVHCELRNGGAMAGGLCSAQVEILRAPKGKLDALVSLVDGNNLPNLQMTPNWQEAETKIIRDRGEAGVRAIQHQAAIGMARQKAMFDSFMATARQNHADFMRGQESRFESSQNAAISSMNARSTAASDMIDFSLDQQTVSGQGGVAKVSSAYGHTWSSTVGNQTQWYQTNNPNADPNGDLPGNWSEDTKVHGNGQAY